MTSTGMSRFTLACGLVVGLLTTPGSEGCSGVTVVSRASWGARRPKSTTAMKTPVSLVFIHHTAGSICSSYYSCKKLTRATQNYHMDIRKYADLGYSFMVGGDGRIYVGRGWKLVGAHTYGYNGRSIGIAFMGNFQSRSPTAAALRAAQRLIACGVSQKYISRSYRLYGHRQSRYPPPTACPGNRLYSIIKKWPHYKPGKAPY